MLRQTVVASLAFLTGGCIGGPTSQTYVMSEAIVANHTTTSDAPLPSLQVEIAMLPAYLDNNEILIRHGPNALESSPKGHWGERLSLVVTHAVAAALTIRLPQYQVSLTRRDDPQMRRLQLEIDSFDVYPDGHCVLVANWRVTKRPVVEPVAVGSGVFVTTPPGSTQADDASVVTAMTAAVDRLADGIVSSL